MWQRLVTILIAIISNLVSTLGGTVFKFYVETRCGSVSRRFLLPVLVANNLDIDGSGTPSVRIKILPFLTGLTPTGLSVEIEAINAPLEDVTLTIFTGLDNDVFPATTTPVKMDFAFFGFTGSAQKPMPKQMKVILDNTKAGTDDVVVAELLTTDATDPLELRAGTFTSAVTVQSAVRLFPAGQVQVRTGDLSTAEKVVDATLTVRTPARSPITLTTPLKVQINSAPTGPARVTATYNAPILLDLFAQVNSQSGATTFAQISAVEVPRMMTLTYVENPVVGVPNFVYTAPNAVFEKLFVYADVSDTSSTPAVFHHLDAQISDIPPGVKLFLGGSDMRLLTESGLGGPGFIGRVRAEYSATSGAPIPSLGEHSVFFDVDNTVAVVDLEYIVEMSYQTQANPYGTSRPDVGVVVFETTYRFPLHLWVKKGTDFDLLAHFEYMPKWLTFTTDFLNIVEWTATNPIELFTVQLTSSTIHSSGAPQRTVTYISAENLPHRFRTSRFMTRAVQWGDPYGELDKIHVRYFIDTPDWAAAGLMPPAVPVRPATIEVRARGLPHGFLLTEGYSLTPGQRVFNYQATDIWSEVQVAFEELAIGSTGYAFGKALIANLPRALQVIYQDPSATGRLLIEGRCSPQPGDPLQTIGGINLVLSNQPVTLEAPKDAVVAEYSATPLLKQLRVAIWGLQLVRVALKEAGVYATNAEGATATLALAGAGDFSGRYKPPASRSLRVKYLDAQQSLTVTAFQLPDRLTLDTDLKSSARLEGAIERATAAYSGAAPFLLGPAPQLRAGLSIGRIPDWVDVVASRDIAGVINTISYSAQGRLGASLTLRSLNWIAFGMRKAELEAELPPGMAVDVSGQQFSTSGGSVNASLAAHENPDTELPRLSAINGGRLLLNRIDRTNAPPAPNSYLLDIPAWQGQYWVRGFRFNVRAVESLGKGTSLGPGTFEFSFGPEHLPANNLRLEILRSQAPRAFERLLFFTLDENLPTSISFRHGSGGSLLPIQVGLSSGVSATQVGGRVGRVFVLLEPSYREIVPAFVEPGLRQAGTGLIRLDIHSLPRGMSFNVPPTIQAPAILRASSAVRTFAFWGLPPNFTASRLDFDGSDDLELKNVDAILYDADFRGVAFWTRIRVPRVDYHQKLGTSPRPRLDPIRVWMASENESLAKAPHRRDSAISFEVHNNIPLNLHLMRDAGILPRPASFNAKSAGNISSRPMTDIQLACFYGLAFVAPDGTQQDVYDKPPLVAPPTRQWRIFVFDALALFGGVDLTFGNSDPVTFSGQC